MKKIIIFSLTIFFIFFVFFALPLIHMNRPSWTIAIYLEGSGSLHKAQLNNLQEILAAKKQIDINVNVIIFLETRDPNPDENIRYSLIEITSGNTNKLKIPSSMIKMSRPEKLQYLAKISQAKFKSDHYALFVAGHGNSWNRNKPVNNEFAFNTHNLYQSLKNFKFDLLVLDLCVMGDIESLWQLAGISDFQVVQQTTVHSSGLNYTTLFENLNGTWWSTPKHYAKEVVETYRQNFKKRMFPISVSAINNQELSIFVKSFQHFIENNLTQLQIQLPSLDLYRITNWSITSSKMIDVGHLLKRLGNYHNIDINIEKLKEKYKQIFINHFNINTIQPLSGISIYFSLKIEGEIYFDLFFNMDFKNGWSKLLLYNHANNPKVTK